MDETVENPMCFYCGDPATMRYYANLSNEFQNAPDGVVEFIRWREAGGQPDRTPVQLVFYVCAKHDAGASDCLVDILGSISGQGLVPSEPCANPFHNGEGPGVSKGMVGEWTSYGCPDCDSAGSHAMVDERDPAYSAMKAAVGKLSCEG